MDHFKFLILALSLFVSSAFAGYAQVSPPSNWTTTAGAAMYKAASNDLSFTNGIRGVAQGALNVGGRSVVMPAAYRFAANAGSIAAASAFGNPALFTAFALGSAIYAWYNSSGYTLENGVWKKSQTNTELSRKYNVSNDVVKLAIFRVTRPEHPRVYGNRPVLGPLMRQ
ncbi:MAG: hypothetical protein Q7J75_01605 [Rhodoferax sp.]|nr:hypothetical protein [Rhodoferax sp.]